MHFFAFFVVAHRVAKDIHSRILRHVAVDASGYIPEGTESVPAASTEGQPPPKQEAKEIGSEFKSHESKESQSKPKEKKSKDKSKKSKKASPPMGGSGRPIAG